MVRIKICGVTSADDALACMRLGVDAIGLNFVPSSPRRVDVATARSISRALAGSEVLVVGVVADLDVDAVRALVRDAELGCVQLHGEERPEVVAALLPHAYKAVRIGGADDVIRARTFPGEHLLVDARVDGALGGSGATFEWSLVRDLAQERKLTLAGGLTPTNVARAVREVAPYAVDVASGVEHEPGKKDLAAVAAFVAAAQLGISAEPV